MFIENVAPLSGSSRLASRNRLRDARLILFIYFLFIFYFVFFSKVSRPKSPARPGWRIRTGARFTPTFSIILSERLFILFHFIIFDHAEAFHFGQAHNQLQFQFTIGTRPFLNVSETVANNRPINIYIIQTHVL